MENTKHIKFSLSISPIAASSIASVGTGIYVGYSHAAGKDASLIAPAITTGIEALVVRNEANPNRNQ